MNGFGFYRALASLIAAFALASASAQFLLPGVNTPPYGTQGTGPSSGSPAGPGSGARGPGGASMGPVLPTAPAGYGGSQPGGPPGQFQGTAPTQRPAEAGVRYGRPLGGQDRLRSQRVNPLPSGATGTVEGRQELAPLLGVSPPGTDANNETSPASACSALVNASSAYGSPLAPDPRNDFQRFVDATVGDALPVFGMSSFSNSTFTPIQASQVPDTYVIGPGDEIIIQIYGAVDFSEQLIVGRDGRISIPKVGPIKISGLRYRDLEAQIQKRVAEVYRNFRLSVSMGRLRAIEIYLVGYAQLPGRKVVSSLSTLVNALFENCGPSPHGTLRAIELRRSGQLVSRLDLYDFIARGDNSADRQLEPGDVIYIPPVGPQVALLGSINMPAIYELAPGGTKVRSILDLSGGLPVLASPQRARLERLDPSREPARFVQDLELDTSGLDTSLKAGDILHVIQVSQRFANAVTLVGSVAAPLRYAFRPGMRVTDLVSDNNFLVPVSYWLRFNTGLGVQGLDQPEVNLRYATVQRFDPSRLRTTTIPFNLGKALRGNARENVALEPGDVVRIFAYGEEPIDAFDSIEFDASFLPGPQRVSWREGYRISDTLPDLEELWKLLERKKRNVAEPNQAPESQPSRLTSAGSLSEPRTLAEQRSLSEPRNRFEPRNLYGRRQLSSIASEPSGGAEGALSPGAADVAAANIQVRNEQGLPELNLEYAAVQRLDPSSLTLVLVPFHLEKALSGDPAHDLRLRPGDRIRLFTRAEVAVPLAQRTRLVRLSGEIRTPGVYQVRAGETLEDVIQRAGGLTAEAYLPGTALVRESTRIEQQRNLTQLVTTLEADLITQSATLGQNLGQSESTQAQAIIAAQRQSLERLRSLRSSGRIALDLDPANPSNSLPRLELEDGDQLSVPTISDFVGIFGAVDINSSLLFRPRLKVRDYLDRAGLRRTADLENLIVLRADGSIRTTRTVSQQRSLLAWRGEDLLEQQIYPGESILVPEQLDRRSPYVRFITGAKDWTQLIYQFGLGAAAFKVLRQ